WKPESFPAPVSNGTNLIRNDLNGQPLQVGIIHATFAGQLGVKFSNFTLYTTNMGPFATTPSAATSLAVTTNANGNLTASWSPGSGSVGSLVVVWTGTNSLVKEMPVNGIGYSANASYGLGSTLPAAGYYVVYAGSGSSVTVSNLVPGTAYNVAVYS